MAICVDELKRTPDGWPWREACHLFDDEGDVERLHAFARRLDLKREWFQNRVEFPHYDLNRRKRMIAVALGAKEVKLKDVLNAAKELKHAI